MEVALRVGFIIFISFCVVTNAFGTGWRNREGEVITAPPNTLDFFTHGEQQAGDAMYINHGDHHRGFQYSSNVQDGVRSQELYRQPSRKEVADYFSFTLKEPLVQEISRQQAAEYIEPGWTFEDSRNRDVDVDISLPLGMRRQIPGVYEITYTAFLQDSTPKEPLSIAKRQVTVYDVNQCEDGTHDCSRDANCIFLRTGGYTCECKPGFRGNGRVCKDIDECAENLATCDIHANCLNTPGSYECVCKPGFNKVNGICQDIDECAAGTANCSPFANCRNLPGSYECKCKDGFEGDGRVCTPINKCQTGDMDCHAYANCIVLPNGGFKCECKQGFRGDGVTHCDDIDECREGLANCPQHSHCVNTFGGHNCVCNQGFQEIDGKCEDIDECAISTHTCPLHSECYNTIGSFTCKCDDGYIENEDGRCVEVGGSPQLKLKGDNPMYITQFSTYSEPGFILEDEKEEISFIVNTDKELHGVARQCGQFNVKYTATDNISGLVTTRNRIVHVTEVDICALPSDHPYSNNCHEYARCVFLHGRCDYTCICPVGYEGNGFGPDGCKDSVPPVVVYNGPDVFLREVCQVCGTALATPDLTDPIITKAYDNTPEGPRDVSDRLVLRTEPSTEPDCLEHYYTVSDYSDNIASKHITVCLKIEDMHTTIMKIEALYLWQVWIIRNVAFLCTLAFILFLVWEFGYRFAAIVRVLFTQSASADDKDLAYSLWYRILDPFATSAKIREHVNAKLFEHDDSDDELDEYEEDSDDEY
mmetsp:Transcript_15890/g.20230  ORF Transcript_15890/g.20230 Transcript_15890/m.20230 type:complete len:760 (-) Transcript_15890:53-2332(-)